MGQESPQGAARIPNCQPGRAIWTVRNGDPLNTIWIDEVKSRLAVSERAERHSSRASLVVYDKRCRSVLPSAKARSGSSAGIKQFKACAAIVG
jgi:hypothetical protein